MGWSYEELMDAPVSWIPIIADMMEKQAENMRKAASGGKEVHSGEEPTLEFKTVRDATTGLVKTRREVTPGEESLFAMFGPPKSRRK